MQLNEAVKEAIKILSEIHCGNMTPMSEEARKSAIKTLEDGLQLTQQKPVAWICAEWSGSGVPELSFDGPPQELSVRDELTRPVWTPLYTAPQPQAVDQQFNTWSHDDGDSWYDNPGDAEIIQSCLGRNAKVGDEYELWASIDAVTLRYRIVAQHGDDFEVECISQPQQKTAPRSPAAQQAPLAGTRCKIIDNCKSCQHSAGRQSCMLANRAFEGRERPPTPPDWCPLPLYTAPNPARQPLTDEQILSIVRVAPALDTAEAEFLHIVRAVEFAHGITGEQQ